MHLMRLFASLPHFISAVPLMSLLLLVAAPHVLPIKDGLSSDGWQPDSLEAWLAFGCVAQEFIRSKTGFGDNKHSSKVLREFWESPPFSSVGAANCSSRQRHGG